MDNNNTNKGEAVEKVAVIITRSVREDSFEHGEVDSSTWQEPRRVTFTDKQQLMEKLNDLYSPPSEPVLESMGDGEYTYSWHTADWDGVEKLPPNYREEYKSGARNIFQQTVFLNIYKREAVEI